MTEETLKDIPTLKYEAAGRIKNSIIVFQCFDPQWSHCMMCRWLNPIIVPPENILKLKVSYFYLNTLQDKSENTCTLHNWISKQ